MKQKVPAQSSPVGDSVKMKFIAVSRGFDLCEMGRTLLLGRRDSLGVEDMFGDLFEAFG